MNTTDIRICVDCACYHANGDTTGIESAEREAEVIAARMLAPGEHIAVGDSDGFSWSSCDACGSDLGGDRFSATLFSEDDEPEGMNDDYSQYGRITQADYDQAGRFQL